MATSARTIVEEARGFHPAFTYKAIPDIVALEEVSRLEQEMADEIVEESGETLAEWQEVAWPADALTAGIPLPPHLLLSGARIWFTGLDPEDSATVQIISPQQAQSLPHMFPSAYVIGDRLRLTDWRYWFGDRHGWEDVARIDILVVPEIAPLTTLGQNITLPDSVRPTLVRGLAMFMADRTGVSLPRLAQSYDRAREAFFRAIIGKGTTRSWQVEVVE